MLLSIRHKTELTYAQRISESVIELRLMPRSDAHQTLRQFHVSVGPDARVSSHIDWQGNQAHQFSVVAFHEQVVIVSNATVETHPLFLDPRRHRGPSVGSVREPPALRFSLLPGADSARSARPRPRGADPPRAVQSCHRRRAPRHVTGARRADVSEGSDERSHDGQ